MASTLGASDSVGAWGAFVFVFVALVAAVLLWRSEPRHLRYNPRWSVVLMAVVGVGLLAEAIFLIPGESVGRLIYWLVYLAIYCAVFGWLAAQRRER